MSFLESRHFKEPTTYITWILPSGKRKSARIPQKLYQFQQVLVSFLETSGIPLSKVSRLFLRSETEIVGCRRSVNWAKPPVSLVAVNCCEAGLKLRTEIPDGCHFFRISAFVLTVAVAPLFVKPVAVAHASKSKSGSLQVVSIRALNENFVGF
jgi:hypothetical protein